MKRIFYPASIVVIGVSEKPDNLAKYIIGNLKAFGYRGELYAVGRRESEVFGMPIVASLEDVPDSLDLAVILTPAAIVPDLVNQCGQKGIFRIVIESGGFSEFSEDGRKLEEQILEIAKEWNIRIVGPNCISVINFEAGVCLPFGPISPEIVKQGPASIISQSGGVSLTFLGMLSSAGVGVNKIVSIGNKADLDETDYIEYLIEDDGTEMICLYLEGISDGRRLLSLAESTSKPIVIHKANRGRASHSVAFSHTAALADDDRIVDGAFRQTGIFRAQGFQDLTSIAQGLMLPPVRGKDLVIISRSGGHAVTAADSAERFGFQLTPLPKSFLDAVNSYMRADVITLTNPMDLGLIFDFELYAKVVEQCLGILQPDAVLLINTYGKPEEEGAMRLAQRVGEISRETNLPIAFCVYTEATEIEVLQQMMGYPVFDDIDAALRGLETSRIWNRRRVGSDPQISPDRFKSMKELDQYQGDTRLQPSDWALRMCEQYQINCAAWEVAQDPEAAASCAAGLGFPIAIKLLSSEISHKSDVGALALNLMHAEDVRTQAESMLGRFNELVDPPTLLVQRMIPEGIEVFIGGVQDPTFGPVVTFGLGGVFVEVYDDVVFRVAPLSEKDACDMLEEIKASQLLDGVRWYGPADRDSLTKVLLSMSRLLLEQHEVLEFDINPLIVTSFGSVAVDARAVVAA
ncbi:MAG: hypothetical protein GTO18_16795 [Anaerolineales bacterium]|nr:hypothetical protein [Anaerolineales bacterium]